MSKLASAKLVGLIAIVTLLGREAEANPLWRLTHRFKHSHSSHTASRHHSEAANTPTQSYVDANPAQPRVMPQPPAAKSPVSATAESVATPRLEKQTHGHLPAGIPVPARPGFVTSPYAQYERVVDVRGFPSGTEVKDPYTGKLFVTP